MFYECNAIKVCFNWWLHLGTNELKWNDSVLIVNMDLNESRMCSNDDARGETKRQSKLSAKALENKIISIQAEQKVNRIKNTVRTIKGFMQTENNAPTIQSRLDSISVLLNEANTVIPTLPVDEQEKQNTFWA